MRSSEGVIEKRGRNRFRSRITIRGRAHSKTFSQLAQAEQWLLDLQLSTGEDDLTHRLRTEQLSVRELIERFRDEVAERPASPESRRREVARCTPLLAQNPEMADMRGQSAAAPHRQLHRSTPAAGRIRRYDPRRARDRAPHLHTRWRRLGPRPRSTGTAELNATSPAHPDTDP